ncbi:MAG: hypothetical protein VB913_15935 [Rhodospirillales bacterium]
MNSPVKTIFKLLVASLLVGWLLKALDLDAKSLLEFLGSFADSLMNIFAGIFEWSLSPILIGALVVIPIWIIRLIWKKATEK